MAWYVRLTWQEGNPTYKGDGFRIYVSVNGGAFSLVTSVPITQTQYDYAVSPGKFYKFRVVEYKNRYIQGTTYVYESPPAEVSVGVPGTPSFAQAYPISTSQVSLRARLGSCTPAIRVEKYVSGAWSLVATKDNLIHTQGNALYDWTQWSHWGNTAYWQSCAQIDGAEMGIVFKGLCALAPTNNQVYLYDYYPYTVTAGTRYAFAIALKADPPTVAHVQAYVVISGGSVYNGDSTYIFLTNTEWRWVWLEVVPGASSTSAGIGLRITLPRPHGTWIYAAAPFFGEAILQALSIPSVWRVRVRGESGSYYTDWADSGNQYIWKKAHLAWTEGNTSQKGEAFVIERKVGNGAWEYYGAVGIGTTQYDDLILPENTTVYWRVYEAYGGRLSTASGEATLTVPQGWNPTDNQPQNLALTWLTIPTTIRLTWQEGAPGQIGDGFKVYRSTNGGEWALVATLPLTQTTYDDGGLSYGNSYQWKVVEYQSIEESTPAYTGRLCLYRYFETLRPSDVRKSRLTRLLETTATTQDSVLKEARKALMENQLSGDGDYAHVFSKLTELASASDNSACGLWRKVSEEAVVADQQHSALARVYLDEQGLLTQWSRWWFARRTMIEAVSPSIGRAALISAIRAEDVDLDDLVNRGLARELWLDVGIQDVGRSGLILTRAVWCESPVGAEAQSGIRRLLFEYADAADGDYRNILRPIWDWGVIQDASRTWTRRGLAESQEATDDWRRLWTLARTLAEAVVCADQRTSELLRRLVEEAEAGDALAREIVKALVVAVLSADVRAVDVFRTLEDLVGISDGDYSALAKHLSEGANMADVLSKGPGHVAADEIHAEDQIQRLMAHLLAEQEAVAWSVVRGLSRHVLDLAEVEGHLAHSSSYTRLFGEEEAILAGICIPPEQTGYKYAVSYRDGVVHKEVLTRRVRLEDI